MTASWNGNIPMKTLVNYLMRFFRECSLELWQRLLFAECSFSELSFSACLQGPMAPIPMTGGFDKLHSLRSVFSLGPFFMCRVQHWVPAAYQYSSCCLNRVSLIVTEVPPKWYCQLDYVTDCQSPRIQSRPGFRQTLVHKHSCEYPKIHNVQGYKNCCVSHIWVQWKKKKCHSDTWWSRLVEREK